MVIGNNRTHLFSLLNLLIVIQYTTAEYVSHLCLGDNFTSNSTYQKNLNILFPSSLSIQNRYYNATVGQNPDTIYGSVHCRGDITPDQCQSCVEMVTQVSKGIDRCPNSKQAIIWYCTCMLRYSNEYYYNIMQDTPRVSLVNVHNISNLDHFKRILGDLMDEVAKLTVSSYSTNFAVGEKTITNRTKVYGLVQCTSDITSSDCNRCLRVVISDLSKCCDGKPGGSVMSPSCYIRYKLYPFFESKVTPSPPQLSSPTPPLSELTIGIVVVLSVIAVLSAIGFGFFCFQRKRALRMNLNYFNGDSESTDSLQFNFITVSAATDNFSQANKLGQGGFGSVYKGTLPDGREIAVKRLSKNSGQGEQEFRNEVTLVAKLQHRNLVKLVGFSLAGEEKLLIYEFMPNSSLDRFLFDPDKCTQLGWKRRYRIIGGVARGLVYLHEESRLKIIHRDLKASNILLDLDWNPKIADFGMARLFVLDQIQDSTSRIVGTHGYMAPEYMLHGEFSVKSDVFSFGVLILEILCGQRNSSFHKSNVARDLLSYAWRHWNNGSAIKILDSTLKDTCCRSEVMICIHVALLCVQENVADRPTMPTVVQMLHNNSVTSHELPSSPAFLADLTRHVEPHPTLCLDRSEEQGCARNESTVEAATWSVSVNGLTVTELYPR